MTEKIVKNISDFDLTIPDVGFVKAGETISVPQDFNNQNFEIVSDGAKKETKTEPKAKI